MTETGILFKEWVDGLRNTMNVCTNNKTECFFKHLKSYISTRGTIEELLEGFMSVPSILRNEIQEQMK